MDSKTQTNKGMKISSKTRVKVAGLINDLHLLQSLPGCTTELAKNYKLGSQFMKYLKELDVISTRDNTVLYVNPKNHSTEYILDYVMTRYQCEYGKEMKADTLLDIVTCEVELPAQIKEIAQEAMYKNQIRNLQSDLNRQEAYIQTLKNELNKKYQIIGELTKKKSIFAKIKNLFQ
jgi:fructose-bisphosphate aldolase class 1